jgi:hypothetical protein
MGLPMLHKMSIQRHKVSSHPFPFVVEVDSLGRIQRKTWCMGPYVGVDYNLNLCRLQYMYHGQPLVSVDFIPQSGT